jgi:hypothetical protein
MTVDFPNFLPRLNVWHNTSNTNYETTHSNPLYELYSSLRTSHSSKDDVSPHHTASRVAYGQTSCIFPSLRSQPFQGGDSLQRIWQQQFSRIVVRLSWPYVTEWSSANWGTANTRKPRCNAIVRRLSCSVAWKLSSSVFPRVALPFPQFALLH